MRKTGFTIIELVIVIAILGILASIAMPKVLGLSAISKDAVLKAIQGSIQTGSHLNFLAKQTNSNFQLINQVNVCQNNVIGIFLEGGQMPQGYSIEGEGDCSLAGNLEVECELVAPEGERRTVLVSCTR